MAQCIAPIPIAGSTRAEGILVPCGRCGYCLVNRKQDWKLRLSEEFNDSSWTFFVTLTYAPEHLPTIFKDAPILAKHSDVKNEMTLFTRHAQLFSKLLRQYNDRAYKKCKMQPKQMRYYAAGEYGERYGRPHYHYIIFNLHPDAALQIGKLWKKGHVKVEAVRSHSKVSNYVSGYVIKAYKQAKTLKLRPMSMMSKRPYIGHQYVTRMKEYHLRNNLPYLELGPDRKQRLPKIFKRKIWGSIDCTTGFYKTAPKCTIPGCKPEPPEKYFHPIIRPYYNPPSEWKLQSEINERRRHMAKLHELWNLYGTDYDAEGHLSKELHLNERRIFNSLKSNDQQ